MAIIKKKSSPQLFSPTFYIALLGFIFGSFALGITLIAVKPLQKDNEALGSNMQSAQLQIGELRYCLNNDLKPCTPDAIKKHAEAQ